MSNEIVVGATVKAKTSAGVQMRREPINGEQTQNSPVIDVFKAGTVVRIKTIVIDYSKWADGEGYSYKDIGQVEYLDALVETDTGDFGWVGVGALAL
jgi:hypothetical protein